MLDLLLCLDNILVDNCFRLLLAILRFNHNLSWVDHNFLLDNLCCSSLCPLTKQSDFIDSFLLLLIDAFSAFSF
jgi:hypothetical protein